MNTDSADTLFSRIVDRESLYDVGTYILGLDDEGLTESQQDFKRCYDLWLGLGNGFSDVCIGTYLDSLPRGVAAFGRIGVTTIATAGKLVLAEFGKRSLPITEAEIDYPVFETDADRERFYSAIRKIDEDYIVAIWHAGSFIEEQLMALASGRPNPTSTAQDAEGESVTIRVRP